MMGLDVGESRIGIALSDPLGQTAQPFETIARDKDSMETLARMAADNEVGAIAAGMPFLMDGTEGKQAGLVRDFLEELRVAVDVPISTVDERLTTKEAESVLSKGRVKRGEKRKASDRVAAALILRAYMDGLPGD